MDITDAIHARHLTGAGHFAFLKISLFFHGESGGIFTFAAAVCIIIRKQHETAEKESIIYEFLS